MFRKNLIELLLNHPMSVSQIARAVLEPPRDVAEDLEHLLKSLRHTDYEAVLKPAHCRKCGFTFSSGKLTKPSRCPECHATWLQEALISLKLNTEVRGER